jgi:uncharacterized protein (DUF488 family)
LSELIDMLMEQRVQLLVDVRRFPGSRRHPQFNRDSLAKGLDSAGIDYRHVEALGGRRSERLPDSPNGAWRVEDFNCYADYMQSGEFEAALADLLSAAAEQTACILCAEALPWRCHRRLIADALVVRGLNVQDIVGPGQVREHALPDFARVNGVNVTYPERSLF